MWLGISLISVICYLTCCIAFCRIGKISDVHDIAHKPEALEIKDISV